MKVKFVILSFLVLSMALPLSFYGAHATTQKTDDDNDTNQAETNETNSTDTENIGQQISNFVHNATATFKQQRNETIQAIQECHQKMQSATSQNRTQIINECQVMMTAIREKYQDLRKQYQELFKEFRQSIIVLRHDAEGLKVSDQDKEKAVKIIDDYVAKNGTKGIATALEHMKGMGMMGIKKALARIN